MCGNKVNLSQKRSNRIALLLVLIGILLRLVWIVHDPLWYDECFTASVIRLPIPDAWQAILYDVHPPGWYLIEYGAGKLLGYSEFALRFPAALCSIGTLLLFSWWLRKLRLSPGVMLLANALMAFSPQQIRYAAEARMYAALSLACLAILVGLTLRRPWLIFLGIVCAPWIHHLGWLFVLPAWIWFWKLLDPDSIVALLDGTAFSLPALSIGIFQFENGMGSYWIRDKSLGAWLYHATFAQFWGEAIMPANLAWHAGIISNGLAILGLVYAIRKRDQLSIQLVMFAWLPGLVLLAVSQYRPMLMARPLIGSGPALFVLGALAVGKIAKSSTSQVLVGLLIAPVIVVGIVNYGSNGIRMGIDPLIDSSLDHECDSLVHTGIGTLITALYYAPDQEHLLWDHANIGLDDAISPETEIALGIRRVPLYAARCVIYSDHVLSDVLVAAELQPWLTNHPPSFVLADDELKSISLHVQ